MAALALSALAAAVMLSPVAADDQAGIIKGSVYADQNDNGGRDDGEPGWQGLEVQFANGDNTLSAITDDLGAFAMPVEAGLWRVSVLPPEDYQLAQSSFQEVEISAEAPEAVLEFRLRPSEPKVVEQVLEPVEQVESGSELLAESPAEAELLPESGAPLPVNVLLLGVFLALGLCGLMLVAAGRRARRF
jgi:hypothetical protein